jgi:serine/threonine protein kinase/ABC-type Fe3+ transport system substrate-binding protein
MDPAKPDNSSEKTQLQPSSGDAATVTPPTHGSGAAPGDALEATLIGPQPSIVLSVPIQDLSQDKLLISAPRVTFEGRTVPALGNIPLLARLGQGGMGAVYFGIKTMLKKEVAVKVLPMHLAQQQPQLVQRFLREAQIAAKIESPHLILVTDVSEDGGLFYLVMEYVRGSSAGALLKGARHAGAQGLDEAMALDICIAATAGLAAAHASGVIHRDVKPENIMVPKNKGQAHHEELEYTAAKLADLGLARADDIGGPSLTGAQAAMGTPGYMAPEQALNARHAGKPADVFSMGATLYAMLGGVAPFKGETATEAVIATIQKPHVPILQVRPNISPVTADLIERCLNKDPAKRYVDGTALKRALAICRSSIGASSDAQAEALKMIADLQSASETGQHLAVKDTPLPASAPAAATPLPSSNAPTLALQPAPTATSRMTVFAAVLAAVAIAGAIWFVISSSHSAKDSESRYVAAIVEGEQALTSRNFTAAEAAFKRALAEKPDDGAALKGLVAAQAGTLNPSAAPTTDIHIGVAFSPEKTEWTRKAIEQFAKTPAGKGVAIDFISMNAPEGLSALLNNDTRITLWSPASDLYRDMFVQEWKLKHNGKDPIVREQLLSLTPMVFVMFEDRYQAMVKKYGALNFSSLSKALQEKEGWKDIAQKPEWRRFSFAFGNPSGYNSGLAALTLIAFDYYNKDAGLTHEDIQSPKFEAWVHTFDAAMTDRGSSAQNMLDMVLRGPSVWDGIFTYESVAIDNLKNAEGRWGSVHISYPELNIWNDNPCFLIDAPWITAAQRKAADAFLDFLSSEPIQKQVIDFGFRPSNPKVGIRYPESPFTTLEKYGLRIDIPTVISPPRADVLKALMELAAKEAK